MQISAKILNESVVVPFLSKFVVKTTTATLAVYEQIVHVTTAGGAFTLTMPNVTEAKGRTYSIHLVAGETTACTLTALGSLDWPGDFTLDATNDRVVLYSDGARWSTVFTGVA